MKKVLIICAIVIAVAIFFIAAHIAAQSDTSCTRCQALQNSSSNATAPASANLSHSESAGDQGTRKVPDVQDRGP